MPGSLEERVAYLEGRVEEHSRNFGDLVLRITALDQKVDRFRLELSARIDALDQKVDGFRLELGARIDALEQRITALEEKVDRFRLELSARIEALDQKTSQQFLWLVGIQITILLAILATFFRP